MEKRRCPLTTGHNAPPSVTERAAVAANAGRHGARLHGVAVGILTQSKDTSRFMALEDSWAPLFDQLMVFESHTDVARVQQVTAATHPISNCGRRPGADESSSLASTLS